MKRTQIQLPDWMFAAAHDLAISKEISMAELVRRGLEYMLAVTPGADRPSQEWELPSPQDLQSTNPFADPNWRADLHTQPLKVAEQGEGYAAGDEA